MRFSRVLVDPDVDQDAAVDPVANRNGNAKIQFMDGHKPHVRGSFGDEGHRATVRGTVLFIWDSHGEHDPHMAVNIESDDPLKPDTWDFHDEIYAQLAESLREGDRIAIDYEVDHHEIVDPDGNTTDGHRPRIVAVRIEND